MPLVLKNPLAFFDLETTGVDVTQDRIVEIAVIKLHPNQKQETFIRRVNPEVPIPAEASSVHGIYDQDIADSPKFKQIARDLQRFLLGCDLAGFNILRFDIPLLVESFLRVGIDFDIDHRKIVDAQRIFHLMEKRNLRSAYQFYCNETLENAHSAIADTKATMAVLQAQVDRYAGQTVYNSMEQPLGIVEGDVTRLHTLTKSNHVDYAGRMVYNEQGVPVFCFGKHKGKEVVQVLQEEPSYYNWIMERDFSLDTKRRLTEIKLNM